MTNIELYTLAQNAIRELLKTEMDEKQFGVKYGISRKRALDAIKEFEELEAVTLLHKENTRHA